AERDSRHDSEEVQEASEAPRSRREEEVPQEAPGPPMKPARVHRGLLAGLIAAALIGGTGATSAEAASAYTVNPAMLIPGGNSFPFGEGDIWPYAGFIYKNLAPFTLHPNDTVAFDLGALNDADVQLQIDMASTTVNGGDVP